jgi:hypothetical protein
VRGKEENGPQGGEIRAAMLANPGARVAISTGGRIGHRYCGGCDGQPQGSASRKAITSGRDGQRARLAAMANEQGSARRKKTERSMIV